MSQAGRWILGMLRRIWFHGVERFWIICLWNLRFLRMQRQKWKLCKVRKGVDRAYADLGAEVYGLHKQDQNDWIRSEIVQFRLRKVEEEELRLFAVQDAMADIQQKYEKRKEEIRSRYVAKRAAVGISADLGEVR